MDLIELVAPYFSKGEVDLKNPEKILRIEILGANAGISLHKPLDVIKINQLVEEKEKNQE